jgi:hypothetical protein
MQHSLIKYRKNNIRTNIIKEKDKGRKGGRGGFRVGRKGGGGMWTAREIVVD